MVVLRCKVAVIGDSKVGKTAMTTTFHGNKPYPKTYVMTMGVELFVKTVNIPETDTKVELCMFDTSGSSIFADVRQQYWEGSSMILAVYDISNKKSFENCKAWVDECRKACGHSKLRGVLVAAKSDMKDYAEVTQEEALELASQLGFGFFECSAATGRDVDAPFNFLASTFHLEFEETTKQFDDLVSS